MLDSERRASKWQNDLVDTARLIEDQPHLNEQTPPAVLKPLFYRRGR